jgi:hypothetical protein
MLVALLLSLLGDSASRADSLHAHVVCPEHGEQVHAGAAASPEAERRPSEIRSLDAAEHGPGCLLAMLANLRGDLVLPAPSGVDVAEEWIVAPPPTCTEPGASAQRDRLELAPKTSPPRA